ncbi:hypothetical protein EVG20_g9619 [Dentipellis fragilis]|uniref:Bromodomain associated domain-containing protein n=1 Tax=Dentipellis fragilis TaxID=205917 RepID=A0A4Y9XZ86_9AGAM|nr:hypothetical protein EVG20_g9619 [Dentipellis fragilis]
MDAGAFKFLESVTLKTLHAHNFARSSTQASVALTDLLSRYLILLSTTCAQYAQHANRTTLTARDAVLALEDLGLSMEELSEYCSYEGEELARYAGHSAKRLEDLGSFKASLADGMPPTPESIPLVYAPVPDDLSDEDQADDESEQDLEDFEMQDIMNAAIGEELGKEIADVLMGESAPPIPLEPETLRRPSSPPLPLSPVSNPSSPARKRPRTDHWRPPPHIPDFLPPFPSDRASAEPEPLALPPPSEPPPAIRDSPAKAERAPSPPRHLSSAPPDYLTPVPYSQSVLAAAPEWHLPPSSIPQAPETASSTAARLPTPLVQPALIGAYHHVLTHPPPANPNAANAARHRVAMALLSQAQRNPRWEPADTLYASTAPNAPSVAVIGPTYPIPVGKAPPGEDGSKEEKEKRSNLPPAAPRSIAALERLAPLVSQQTSRIPELARNILSGPVHSRTTRLGHPPFIPGDQAIMQRPSIPAPWNSSVIPPNAAPTPTNAKGKESLANGVPNGKGKETDEKEKALPDARYYTTWQYEPKSFKEPLALRRPRQGSIQLNRLNLAGGRASRPM